MMAARHGRERSRRGSGNGFFRGVPWAVLALAGLLAAPFAAAGDEARAASVARELVQVLDERGRIPAELTASDLVVWEGGEEREVVGLERLDPRAKPLRVVLYFDRELSGSGNLKRSAAALAPIAGRLVELGEVEVVDAREVVETAVRSRDELVVAEHLSRAALTETGASALLEIRQRVLRDLRVASPAASALGPEEVAEIVAAGIEEELEWIRGRLDLFLAWASETPAAEPGILAWVVDGFDLDPVEFYLQRLDDSAIRAVIGETSRFATLEMSARETGQALAALGWTLWPMTIASSDVEAPTLEYAPITIDSGAGNTTAAPGITLRPGQLFGRRDAKEPEPEIPAASLVSPRVPLRRLAEATGGEVVVTDGGLRDAIERFRGRYELSYRSLLPASASLESIEVRGKRPGWKVRSRKWASRGIPEKVAAVRLDRLLDGIEDDGGFDVAAVLKIEDGETAEAPGAAQLEARLELRELEGASEEEGWSGRESAVLRVSLAVAAAGRAPEIRHEIVTTSGLGEMSQWRYQTAIELPPGATEVGVLIEDLSGGYWGGRRATVVQGSWGVSDDLLPAPTVVEVVNPAREVLRGRVKFETEVYDSRVARVDFLLDDREVASAGKPPFSARLDLGRTPRRRTLTVVALDAESQELGRDSVVLNGGGTGLEVEIVRPANRRGVGWVEVEAEITVPVESRLDRALFFWNNEPVATVYSPPFRQRVYVPEDKPVGYVRVVALLEDGSLAEDVAFMNGPAHGERLEVNLVELYVVVTDPNGRPVRGLTQEEFSIREDGVPQSIAAFSDASDLPLTLGMAIDSSASMFVKLPSVQNAASAFLRSTFSDQDRAFVVDFDSEPRLARSTTGNLDRILSSIGTLEANGRTALWESIVFSLVQLQGVRGRKALVVFSDGADEDDQFPFRSSISVAKKMGVPIYLILMRKQPKKETGLSLLTRSFTSRVNRLVEATGGRVFYAKEYRDLGEVYDEIESELRSQYLLAYYPREPSRGESWRTVDVDVDRRGLRPRTLSGYWD